MLKGFGVPQSYSGGRGCFTSKVSFTPLVEVDELSAFWPCNVHMDNSAKPYNMMRWIVPIAMVE